MRTTLKLAVLVTFSLLFITVGLFVYPLMQDPFERQSIDPMSVNKSKESTYLEFDLTSILIGDLKRLTDATLFVWIPNTVEAYYCSGEGEEPLPIDWIVTNTTEGAAVESGRCYMFNATKGVIDAASTGKAAFILKSSNGEQKFYMEPSLTIVYWKPSTLVCSHFGACIFFPLFIISAIATAISAIVRRESSKQKGGGRNEQ